MAGEVYSSRLPWVWVVEILARSHEVDAAILHDLITRMPKFSGDLEKEAREMIAWRCLESLFDPANGFKNDNPPSLQSKDRFDVSECCENVLQCILRETLLCTLEQLKDTILQGSHPLVMALKNFNGLIVQNQHNERILPDGDDIIVPPSRHDGFGVNGRPLLQEKT
ncbi:hypothetical protein Nepgr_021977 [Nepenthes gracilis]|uniref:Uncharacterized protein n=1 Tax=Nepenthes gracilis TaxID=150966 RepID=A0AAD3T1T4_NEPGR|nr:hypothetical protein Nepgr_021977 [Nepenthes gracilis]